MDAPEGASASGRLAANPAASSTGVAILVRGAAAEVKDVSEPKPAACRIPNRGVRRLVQVSLVLGDLALLGLALCLALRRDARPGWEETALGVLSLTFGAWLSCLALWLEEAPVADPASGPRA